MALFLFFIFYQFTKQSFDNQQCISSLLATLSPQNKELVIMFLFGMVKKKKKKKKSTLNNAFTVTYFEIRHFGPRT